VVLWSGELDGASEACGNSLFLRPALALMKSALSGQPRRITGTSSVLSCVETSTQACYEWVCQTKPGPWRRASMPLTERREYRGRMTRTGAVLLGGVAAVMVVG
jgi:hypothetical protein